MASVGRGRTGVSVVMVAHRLRLVEPATPGPVTLAEQGVIAEPEWVDEGKKKGRA